MRQAGWEQGPGRCQVPFTDFLNNFFFLLGFPYWLYFYTSLIFAETYFGPPPTEGSSGGSQPVQCWGCCRCWTPATCGCSEKTLSELVRFDSQLLHLFVIQIKDHQHHQLPGHIYHLSYIIYWQTHHQSKQLKNTFLLKQAGRRQGFSLCHVPVKCLRF